MNADTKFVYRDFMLNCDPVRSEDGRFREHVVIDDRAGVCIRALEFPEFDEFNTEAEAIAHGKEDGMHWIDEHVPTLNQSFAEALGPVVDQIKRTLDETIEAGVRVEARIFSTYDTSGVYLTGSQAGASPYRQALQVLLCWQRAEMLNYVNADVSTRRRMAANVAARVGDSLQEIGAKQHIDFDNRTQEKTGIVLVEMEGF